MTDLVQKLVGALEMADDAFDLEGFHPEGATRREIRAALSAAKDGGWVAVRQFRTDGCADWYDGFPDQQDGGGPYETRTLYALPNPPKEGV